MSHDPQAYARSFAELVAYHEEGYAGSGHAHALRVEDLASNLIEVLREHTALPEDAGIWAPAMVVHDLGKLRIPDALLRKPAPLQPEELALVRQHTSYGEQALRRLAERWRPLDPDASHFWTVAAVIAGGHHERTDGEGYPRGLRGSQVPLVLRLARAVDVYDALTSRRAYREALAPARALNLMRSQIGGFDEAILEAIERLHRLPLPSRSKRLGLEPEPVTPQVAPASR